MVGLYVAVPGGYGEISLVSGALSRARMERGKVTPMARSVSVLESMEERIDGNSNGVGRDDGSEVEMTRLNSEAVEDIDDRSTDGMDGISMSMVRESAVEVCDGVGV